MPTELENVEKITAFMECFPEVKCNPYDAQNGDAEPVELDLCVGRTAACAFIRRVYRLFRRERFIQEKLQRLSVKESRKIWKLSVLKKVKKEYMFHA